jgi:hypothetical protein
MRAFIINGAAPGEGETSRLRRGPSDALRAVAAKPVLPPPLYLWAGNYLMRKKARKMGIRNLEDRPYSRKDVRGD